MLLPGALSNLVLAQGGMSGCGWRGDLCVSSLSDILDGDDAPPLVEEFQKMGLTLRA